jgi:predicted TIM-barrel fold metal-dependent hydrolase
MLKKPNCPVIAIEEHYWDPELSKTYSGVEGTRNDEMLKRLYDLGDLRLKDMDEAGVDMQIISHGAPSAQKLTGDDAVPLTRRVNDRLAEAVARNPKRFAGFATLPTSDPAAAADELERAVTKLSFKGAMVHGLTNGRFIDEKQFWPIFARAEALDVPVYLHPGPPHPTVIETYYKDYAEDYPHILSAGWGYTVETATQALRMVLSGVFDAHPRLKIILGHLGEGLPFLVWRIDHSFARPGNRPGLSFRDVFCGHFYVTTSGNFSDPALLCSVMEMGADRILYSVDWPFVANPPGTAWMKNVPLSTEDKAKILGGNAARLLRL